MATTETVASDHTSATDEQIVKKEKSEAIAEMIASLANEDEVKHDKPEDAAHADGGHTTPAAKAEGVETASLANEDEVKHDKPEDAAHADGGHTTPAAKAEGVETNGELVAVKVEKTDDSPPLEASAEDNLKHDKIEDAQTPETPFSKTQEDDKKAEPALVVEKTDDPVSLEAHIADNLKGEKESLPDSHTTSDAFKSQPEETLSTEATVKETPRQLEKEPVETEEEKQPKTVDIPETSPETIGISTNTTEANPQTGSEAEEVKEAEILETSAQKEEKPEPVAVATEVQKETQEPEKESQEKLQEAEKPSTVTIPEPSIEANAIEEKTREPSAEILKETNDYEAGPTEGVKAEPVVAEVEENPKETEKQSLEQKEEEQPDSVTIPQVSSAETSEVVEEKTRELEVLEETKNYKAEPVITKVDEILSEPEKQSFKHEEEELPKMVIPETESDVIPQVPSAENSEVKEEKTIEPEVLEETKNYNAGPTETDKAEPVITKVNETLSEPEIRSFKQEEEKLPKTVITETEGDVIPQVPSAETSEVIEEKTREPEVSEDTKNYEAGATESEKAEPAITKVDENPSEPEKQSFKQKEELPKTIIPETAGDAVEIHPPKESDIDVVKEIDSESEAVPGKAQKPGDVVVVHPSIELDIEVVKEIRTSELEAVSGKEEKPEPVSTEVEEKPRELLEVAEEAGKTSKDVETKQEIVLETTKIEETSDDTNKDPISLNEDKTNKEEETSITANTAQVSLNEKAQAATENLVEPSPEVAEKVVEEDGKKESSFTDVIEGVSKDEAGVLKTPEQASIDQEAKTDLKEETEHPVPTSVEEKIAVAAAADDDKKEPEQPEAVQVSSREAEIEINRDEEQIEAKTATTEAGDLKVESIKDNGPAVDNEKGGHTDTKVDEISSAVSEPVRETLASKFEEEEATKTGVDNLKKEQTEEPVKTEVQVPEPPTKESDATKTSSKDLPKETPAKSTQKQSNNIISKVKQSLVKAKKAITGKSPSSKNLSSEPKDDIKVK